MQVTARLASLQAAKRHTAPTSIFDTDNPLEFLPPEAVRGNSFALLSSPSVRSFRHVKAWIDRNSELNRESEKFRGENPQILPKIRKFSRQRGN
jgi:hypothetical protein